MKKHAHHPYAIAWLARLGILTLAAMLFAMPATPLLADDHDHDHDHEDEHYEEEEEVEGFLLDIELFERLLGLVETMKEIADSPTLSAVAAVMGVEDHVEGPGEMVEMLEPLLEESDDETVQRVIRFKLIDAYSELDQPEKVKEHLRALILQVDD
ncbi:MAG: hypothetical protein AAF797_04800 [Planctomycetota bacterium]